MRAREDAQLVDIGVEDLVHEADGRRLERILVRELDMDLPQSTGEWRLIGVLEAYVELLHVVVHEGDLIIAHEPMIEGTCQQFT